LFVEIVLITYKALVGDRKLVMQNSSLYVSHSMWNVHLTSCMV